MKILIVCQFYYPENFVISKIAESLVSRGHDVTVLTGKPNYGYGHILEEYKDVKYEVINGVKVNRVNLVPRSKSRFSIIRNYLSFWSNSKKWVRKTKEKFDIVYSMSLSPVTILSAGNLYKKKHHVPHVVHCVDLWPESVLITHAVNRHSPVYTFLYWWSKALYKKADKILLGSPSFAEYFDNVLKISSKDMIFVPQPSLIETPTKETVDLGDDFNILYCGNLGRIQLINLIPESMNLLRNEKIKFHVIGMGPMTEMLESKIKEYRLEEKVIYHGPIPAKKAQKYFNGADALYISLKGDGYVGKTIPNKVMMSMVFKKPVVACLTGDGRDALDKSGGALFADETPESVANAIKMMSLKSKEQLKKLGELNQAYYKKHFSLEKVTSLIETTLEDFKE